MPDLSSTAPNIFNDRQEQDLGDALAEYFESEMRIAPPAAEDELTRLGERLLATLPPTGIRYRFRIYDSGEINGFSVAGGRVYISRKLIAALKSQDELAGVLAHEIGHLATHQTAIAMTRAFRLRLGVTQVSDRADIFARVHQYMSTPPKKNEAEGKEEKDELVADGVALNAMLRAGYAPETFPAFLDEITVNKGKTGNWLSDAFGITGESAQRYRSALQLIGTLPAACKGRQPGETEAFKAWVRATVDERVQSATANASQDKPMKLDPPLRPSLWRIRFSSNGHYLLAQDESSITVIDREAGKALFRVDAPNAYGAQFTPDSESVVFHDDKLRVERWSVSEARRSGITELVVFGGCYQTYLSQDGKTLACANMTFHNDAPSVDLKLIDVETGKAVFEKLGFYEAVGFDPTAARWLLLSEGAVGEEIVQMVPSPDGRYLLMVAGNKSLAYDLFNRQQIQLGGKLRELTQTRVVFIAPNEVYFTGQLQGSAYPAKVVSFPDGHLLAETQIGTGHLEAATKPNVLIMSPLKDYAVALLDPVQKKVLAASKLSAIDAWEQYAAVEDPAGGVQIGQLAQPGMERVSLPLGPLPDPRAAAFSRDGKFLAVSVKTRSSIWNLETGKQIMLGHPFRSAWIDESDHMFAQFPKYMGQDAEEMRLDLDPLSGKNLAKFEEGDTQWHNLQVRYKQTPKEMILNHVSTLEVKNMETQAVDWTRDYNHERPAIWSADDGRMVLGWDLNSEAAKIEIKNTPALEKQLVSLGNHKKGILLETVAAETGEPLQQVILPEVDLTHGHNDRRSATVSGQFVLAEGEHDNTSIYRLGTGAKVGEFFGWPVATDAEAGIIAASNREEEIIVFAERSGKEISRFTLGSPVLAAQISGNKEKTLLVLTDDQTVHRIPLPHEE